jgi:diguanylate cyclase (GGDEF)-like protein
MMIGELMTAIGACASPDDRVSVVVAKMRENHCSCALISEDGSPLGILTERDIVRVFLQSLTNDDIADMAISELMTRDPICLSISTSLYDALILARSHKVRHFPVIDNDEQLVGLVTQTDMVNAYITFVEQQADLKKENQHLKLLLNEDVLMKIGNRRAMEVELEFSEASAKRYKKNYCVALLDVDWFKKYNDHYGHPKGDATLQAFAAEVKSQMRDSDMVFRYGGEELLLLMPETSPEEAINAAERARAAVENMMLPHGESTFGFLTLSVGVASGGQEPWQALVKRADEALYKAKDSGRNRVVAV